MNEKKTCQCLIFDQTTNVQKCKLCQGKTEASRRFRQSLLELSGEKFDIDFYCPLPDWETCGDNEITIIPDAMKVYKDRKIELCIHRTGVTQKEKKCCGGKVRMVNMISCDKLNREVTEQQCRACRFFRQLEAEENGDG